MPPSRFDDIPNLQPENWAGLSFNDRIVALQRTENRIADSLNRPRLAVIDFVDVPEKQGRLDRYDPIAIEINKALIDAVDPEKAVSALVHEGRHGYQIDCVNNPAKHPEVSRETIEAWMENMKRGNYIISDRDFEGYKSQPLEADAYAFEKSIMQEIYPQRAQALEKTDHAKESVLEQDDERTARLAHWRDKSRTELPKVTKSPAILEHEHDRDPTD